MTGVLFVAWQDPESRSWYTVGKLTRLSTVYRFEYTKGALRSPRFLPFGRMSDLHSAYESRELFPLFANRLLTKDRPEYREFLHWLDLRETEDDPLALLARSGGIRETDSLMVFPSPEPTAAGQYHVKFFVQGIRYTHERLADVVRSIVPFSRLFLMPDPQNDYDRYAIALRTGDPKTLIGYCPRYLTEDLHFLLRTLSPSSIEVLAERINSGAPIQLRLLCAVTCEWPAGFSPCGADDFQSLSPSVVRLPRKALA